MFRQYWMFWISMTVAKINQRIPSLWPLSSLMVSGLTLIDWVDWQLFVRYCEVFTCKVDWQLFVANMKYSPAKLIDSCLLAIMKYSPKMLIDSCLLAIMNYSLENVDWQLSVSCYKIFTWKCWLTAVCWLLWKIPFMRMNIICSYNRCHFKCKSVVHCY